MSRSYARAAVLGVVGLAGIVGAQAAAAAGPSQEYLRLKERAEGFCAEQSWSRALPLYQQAAALPDVGPDEARWVAFRIGDTMWRAQAGSRTLDNTVFESARRKLESVIDAIRRPEERDRAWAEAQESLADFWWSRPDSANWGQGWPHYQQALDWWAGQQDLKQARRRYLDIVWRMAEPEWRRRQQWYGYNNIPLDILENAGRIARTDEDRARAHYLLALGLTRQGSWPQRVRVETEFEAALEFGARNPWYDDALFQYAQWLASNGRVTRGADGQWRQEPDFVKAVELYERLTREFRKGQTRYYDDAQNQIKAITEPQLTAAVGSIFLPGSEITFELGWRNLKGVDLSLYRVNLTDHLDPTRKERQLNEWVRHIDRSAAEKVKSWTYQTNDAGEHKWGRKTMRVEMDLPIGAYVLVATSGGRSARELILITDVAVVLKSWKGQVLAYVCDALDGSPIEGARVRLWTCRYLHERWTGDENGAMTGQDGLCRFKVNAATQSGEHFQGYIVTASVGGRQAFDLGGRFRTRAGPAAWKIYASTDRPAYRPQDTVHWKMTARTNDGSGYATPAAKAVHYEINGPRGKVKEGDLTLSDFGSAWDELPLAESMALGEYTVSFWTSAKRNWIGQSPLFRLEEYKLPEFEVSVTTPADEQGRKKAFRLGERVEVSVEAGYYFGGPVANANVELVVYQSPFYHLWMPQRDYPWCYGGRPQYGGWGGYGQVVKQETLKTDGTGRATLFFDTPIGGSQDLQYRIEARVTDASRREIIGSDTVRVTRQRYFVHPRSRHNLYAPGDKVEIDFTAVDANDQPMSVLGNVVVTRDRWVEEWLDPSGRLVAGWHLREAQRQQKVFPPPPMDGQAPWRLKYRGYNSQEILARTIKTDENGLAVLAFVAPDEGYYRIAWTSEDPGAADVTAQTTVWVANGESTELGYRQGGLEIIVDKDTFRSGQTAAVMLSVPTGDRFVLFSVEGNDLHSYQLVHVTGTVKLIQVPIGPEHVPNVFLRALMVSDGQVLTDTEEVVVPPVENFIEVSLRADQEAYMPRAEGTLTVVTRDVDGNPVPAEVALSMVDESVYYIQQEYAGDPREFFFNDRQEAYLVQTSSTFNHKRYVKLVEDEEGRIIDARQLAQMNEEGGVDTNGFEFRTAGQLSGGMRQAPGRAGMAYADDAAPMEMAEASSEVSNFAAKAPAARMRGPADPDGQGAGAGGGEPAVVVRSDFRSTIFWQPDIVTDHNGLATVPVTYADTLTRWKAVARAATAGNRFGMGGTTTRTRQPLIARLQAPRFFVVGDTVTLSGIFNNNTQRAMTIRPQIEVKGLTITGVVRNGRTTGDEPRAIEIAAGSEATVDWNAVVEEAGEARVWLTARSDEHADAMEKTFTVYDHGIEQLIVRGGKVRGREVAVRLDLPAERRVESTALTVGVSSSMAVTMLDALPYLVDYPYGCTEQTMSRFLPAVVTARTLADVGLSPEDALGKVFGGIERQFVDRTHPGGDKKRRNLQQLDRIVNEGLDRLYDFQHGDGGWGWWKTGDSDPFMSAYILWGLSLARESGLDVRGHVMERAARYLDLELVEAETAGDLAAWMLHALGAYHAAVNQQAVSENEATAIANLWKRRDGLNAYTRALFALAAHHYGDTEKAQALVRNLENGVRRDDAPDTSILLASGRESGPAVIGTAHWGEDGIYWRWSDGGVEATAFALRAMLAIDPANKLIEPVTNWLIKNRRGGQWSNTRDTAITVLALNDYLRAGGELEPQFEYELIVNGETIARKTVTAAEALGAPSRFQIDRAILRDGPNEVRIVRHNGEGPIYFSAEASFVSLQDPVPAAGNEIFVRRDYYKLQPRETLLKGYVYEREPLLDGDYVTSGERVEVVITVEAKNNYEYLVFEDLKPAGLEAVQIRSGESMSVRQLKSGAVERLFEGLAAPLSPPADLRDPGRGGDGDDFTGLSRAVHQELRDRKVALFVDRLAQGAWQMTYDLRAEVPGQFHALPVLGHAMYVPEIRCNSAEVRITVNDRPGAGIVAVGD